MIIVDKYDAVISFGTFVKGHLKADCIPDMCKLVKPGGFLSVVCYILYVTNLKLHVCLHVVLDDNERVLPSFT